MKVLIFVLGALTGGLTMTFIMSAIYLGKQSDNFDEEHQYNE